MQSIFEEYATLESWDFAAGVDVRDVIRHAEDIIERGLLVHSQVLNHLLLL